MPAAPRSVATIDLSSLPAPEIAGRAGRLAEHLASVARDCDDLRCDALLVTHITNIRYLTGFTGSAAQLLVIGGELSFVTDGRYGDQAAAQLEDCGVHAAIEVSTDGQSEILAGMLEQGGVRRLGVESAHVAWAQQRRLADEFEGVELIALDDPVGLLRQVKDAGEVARIELAARIASDAFASVRHQLLEQPTERELALALDTAIRRMGADGNSFETIVGSGPNGAQPHLRPGDRVIRPGDLVVLDFGALVDGYCSDMTRTLMVGEPSAVQSRMLEVVLESQQAGVDALVDGVEAKAVDAVCRQVIDDAGWGDAFVHSTGHGVGLDIHEPPRLARTSEAVIRAGQVVTVEPGVYLPEHGGVRIEDTLVVSGQGARSLTPTTKSTAV